MRMLLLVGIFIFSNFVSSFTNPQQSKGKVDFSIKKVFATVKGEFTNFDYTIILNETGSNSINGTAEVKSITTDNLKRDKNLTTKDWFNSELYPQITIQSKKIVKQKESEYIGTFEIVIKGKTLIKEIPFKIASEDSQKKLLSSFELSLDYFDIGGGIESILVSDKVTINLNLPF